MACTGVRSMTAELGLSGRAGDQRIPRVRIISGFARPSSMRLEAIGAFGRRAFTLVARDGSFRAAVDAAQLHLQPFPYVVVRDAFPDRFYDALVRGIPPVEMFADKPLNKQSLKVPFPLAPVYSRRVWNFFVHRAAPRVLQPVLLDKFREPLREWIAANWPSLAADRSVATPPAPAAIPPSRRSQQA